MKYTISQDIMIEQRSDYDKTFWIDTISEYSILVLISGTSQTHGLEASLARRVAQQNKHVF